MFPILEEIGQQLESKHTFTLGQLFKFSFDLNNMLLPNYLLGEIFL
jgi:hypothetical protein